MTLTFLNRYQTTQLLPETGIAQTYVAEDKILPREVIVKVMPQTHQANPLPAGALLEGFVRIHDTGIENNHPVIISSYMPGGSLEDRIKSGSISIQESVELIIRLANILNHVHNKGVVHGNLKPTNVLFTKTGEAYLSDHATPNIKPDPLITSGKIFPNNAEYVSPEQARGETIDKRSDVYSLGILFYMLLTAHLPFEGKTPVETVLKHLNEPAPPLSRFVQDLPVGFQQILDKALAKDPAKRYVSIGAMGQDIETIFQEYYKLGPSSSGKLRKTGRWRLVALVGLIGIILIGILFFPVWTGANSPFAYFNLLASPTTLPPTETPPPTFTPLRPTTTPSPTETEVPTETSTPTPTQETSPTPTATFTLEPTPAPSRIIGGADMIAVVNNHNIWLAYLDGNNLHQLTDDGNPKSQLHWTPDGQGLIYRSQGCYHLIQVFTNDRYSLGCFDALRLSSDGTKVIVTKSFTDVDAQTRAATFVLPYNLLTIQRLKEIHEANTMGACVMPKASLDGVSFEWAQNDQTLAILLVASSGIRTESILVYSMDDPCGNAPRKLDNFPDIRFTLRGYNDRDGNGKLDEFDWDGIRFFAISGDVNSNGVGDLVIYDYKDKKGKVLNPEQGKCCYRDIRWSPDGLYLLYAFQDISSVNNEDLTVLRYVLYEAIEGGLTSVNIPFPDDFFIRPKEPIYPALRPANAEVAINLWPEITTVGTNANIANRITSGGPVYSLALNTDNTLLGIGTRSQAQSRTLSGGRSTNENTDTPNVYVNAVAYSPDVEGAPSVPFFAIGQTDGAIKSWRVSDGVPHLFFQTAPAPSVSSLAFSPDARYLAAGLSDKTVIVYRAQNGGKVITLKGHTGAITSVAFTDARLLSASIDGTIRIWDSESWELLYELTGHNGPVWDLAVSADGQYVASASADQTIKLWQIRGGELLHTFEGHTAPVLSVVFSHDGQHLYSGGEDQAVRVWNVTTLSLEDTLIGINSSILSLAISTDDESLYVGGWDGTISVINLP